MDFVWVYAKQFSFYHKSRMFNELKYSIKTVQKFYKDARIWVVGDPPGEMDDEIESGEINLIHTGLVQTGKSGLHRDNIDLMRKFKAIIESDINEEFVLMYDDQFILRDITYKDLQPTALCRVPDVSTYPRIFGLLYGSLWRSTYKVIDQMTDNIYDWETHLPRLMEKEKTEFLIDTYDLENKNIMIHPLYYTLYATDPILIDEDDSIRSHTWTIGRNTDWDDIFSKKFLIISDESCVPDMWNRIIALV